MADPRLKVLLLSVASCGRCSYLRTSCKSRSNSWSRSSRITVSPSSQGLCALFLLLAPGHHPSGGASYLGGAPIHRAWMSPATGPLLNIHPCLVDRRIKLELLEAVSATAALHRHSTSKCGNWIRRRKPDYVVCSNEAFPLARPLLRTCALFTSRLRPIAARTTCNHPKHTAVATVRAVAKGLLASFSSRSRSPLLSSALLSLNLKRFAGVNRIRTALLQP
jgi:hypothetical protein